MSTISTHPILTVDSLTHTYNLGSAHPTKAIENITFDMEPGHVLSVVGPSGCGKTTLLRSLTGLQKPTGGRIELSGTAVTSPLPEMSMVFQDYSRSLFPWLTIEKNIRFGLSATKTPRAEQDERVSSALQSVGLTEHAGKHPWQLSGGMQQRTAIARALARHPEVLIMDEPFASVDAQTRESLEDLVLRVQAELRSSILFVTHDIDESVYLADRVLVLCKSPSRIIADIAVDLPRPRDHVSTKKDPRFVELRSQVAEMVRAAAEGRLA